MGKGSFIEFRRGSKVGIWRSVRRDHKKMKGDGREALEMKSDTKARP